VAKTTHEVVLAGLWAKVMGVNFASVGTQQHFFRSGGDSLLAVRLISAINSRFDKQVQLKAFFVEPTIAQLAIQLSGAQILSQDQQSQITSVGEHQTVVASKQQQRLWMLDKLNEHDLGAYNIFHAFNLQGQLQLDKLALTLDRLIWQQSALRTVFSHEDQQVMQTLGQQLPPFFSHIDLSDLPAPQREQELRSIATKSSQYHFDLSADCLLRCVVVQLQADEFVMMICVHHIAADGWSVSLLTDAVNQGYNQFCEGVDWQPEPLAVQYRDYSAWQQTRLAPSNPIVGAELAFWKNQLDGIPACHNLSTDRPRPVRQTFSGEVVQQRLNVALSDKLRQFSNDNDVTLFMMLESAFAVLMARYSYSDDIVIGTPVANRPQVELDGIVGCFINTIVLRNQIPHGISFAQLLQRNKTMVIDSFAHSSLPFEYLVEQLQVTRDTSFSPVFQLLFVLHNNRRTPLALDGIQASHYEVPSRAAKFDLTLNVFDGADELVIDWEFNCDLFDRQTVAAMGQHFETLCGLLIDSPSTDVRQLRVWSNQANVVPIVQGEVVSVSATVDQLFVAAVKLNPSATAVRVNGESIDYQTLNNRVNQLAVYLLSQGVETGDKLAVIFDHQIELIISLLAAMKIGAAYVPLDSDAPLERKRNIIEQANIAWLLCDGDFQSLLNVQDRVINVAQFNWHDELQDEPLTESKLDQLAYILFTSGSTGKPKGVEIEQGALANLLLSMAKKPGFTASDRFLAVTPLTFDISGLELFLPLITGGTLVLGGKQLATDGKQLAVLLEQEQITMMQATPTMWRVLCSAGWDGKADLRALSGGEAIPLDLANMLANKTAQLWNMYGPTETTIWSFCSQLARDCKQVNIGYPIDNTDFCVLDDSLCQVPAGIPGQLYIGGAGLARGYLNRTDLTDAAFIEIACQRWYGSGDLVKLTADQGLLFLGRLDHQIKLRGFRMEPGEIEAQLNSHPQVNDSLVLVYPHEDGSREDLVAYYVADNGDSLPQLSELRRYLGKTLPAYMIPTLFVPLSEFSLTSSGKKDRKALPQPKASRAQKASAGQGYVAPQNELEQFIVDQLKQMLKADDIGSKDNFFELGAVSLDLVVLAQRLSEHLSRNISAVELFDKTSATQLANWLGSEKTVTLTKPDRSVQRDKAKSRLQARMKRKTGK
jgi:amino acid adenylation domain-containing protein